MRYIAAPTCRPRIKHRPQPIQQAPTWPDGRRKLGRAACLLLLCARALPAHGQAGRDWGIEKRAYQDPVTGQQIWELTGTNGTADNLYFHVSNFTADNHHLIFTSTRDGSRQIFTAEIPSGRITQLTGGSGVQAAGACPDPTTASRVYYIRAAEVLALDIGTLQTRSVGTIPPPHQGGFSQPSPSGDGRWLALSKQRDAANWEIGLMDTRSGAYRTVITQGFPIGHVQHSPIAPVIFYVWETGGYAPQRTWLVNSDGSGNRPFYARLAPTNWFTPLKEWVTHEAWIAGTGEMTMVNDKLGIMIVKPDGSAHMVREGRYWHAAASPDGRRLVLDDFDGRLWLCEAATGSVRLLATQLRDTVSVHPHASFDRSGRFIQFHSGRTHETVALLDLEPH